MAMRGLFITGTDTGVGKTFVACAILRAWRAAGIVCGAYKPACSGAVLGPDRELRWDDVDRLWESTGSQFPRERICPQRFAAPLAPPAAAALEGASVDPQRLAAGLDWWRGRVELILVEGAGGLLSPLAEGVSNADLAQQLGLPLLIIAADRLGTINHTLLTLEAAHARALPVAGVVLNRPNAAPDPSTGTNLAQLRRACPALLLAEWHFEGADALRPGGGRARIDWRALAGA